MRDDYVKAKDKTEQAILDAEKYKAVLAEPPGAYFAGGRNVCEQEMNKIGVVDAGISDDDFFHLTCHVDANLIGKIERGEFVDLEKLLPKDRKRKSDKNRMEWVHSDGNTFLAPITDRSSKITSFRRWEQAFRTYATIYCGAENSHRAKEIWQYISVISTASSSYIWDNVYDYDITFRHLMAFNPNRSWAVTYNQMWNLCMREPIQPRGSNTNNFQRFGNANQNGGKSNGNTGHKKKGKPTYCWNFNRGIPCKYGKNCRYIERCSYCDASSHGVNTCLKVEKKEKESHGASKQN